MCRLPRSGMAPYPDTQDHKVSTAKASRMSSLLVGVPEERMEMAFAMHGSSTKWCEGLPPEVGGGLTSLISTTLSRPNYILDGIS